MRERFLDDYPDVLLPEEAKEILGIGRNKIYTLLKTKELPAKKIGRQYRIPKKALSDYLNSWYNDASMNDVSVGAN